MQFRIPTSCVSLCPFYLFQLKTFLYSPLLLVFLPSFSPSSYLLLSLFSFSSFAPYFLFFSVSSIPTSLVTLTIPIFRFCSGTWYVDTSIACPSSSPCTWLACCWVVWYSANSPTSEWWRGCWLIN